MPDDTLIPAPRSRTAGGGTLPTAGPWHVTAADPRLRAVAGTVRALLAPHLDLAPGPGGAGTPAVRLELGDVPLRSTAAGLPPDGSADPDECHQVTVDAGGVRCRARTPLGVFRAAVSALHLLTSAAEVPHQRIDDAPRYAWRGLLVDVVRTFFTPGELRRVVDLAALYKLNVLHLHLTDDQGWRLELATRPRLTDPAHNPGHRADLPDVRAHYTAAEYRDLQRYAAERFVTVVPEIDLPGHCAAVLRACPEVAGVPRPAWLDARVPYGPPLDPGSPATAAFVADVLGEVAELTHGPFVHIGGDEALGISPAAFTDAVALARTAVRAAGKRPLGWQESVRAGMGPQDVGQFWVDVPMTDLPATQQELELRPELLRNGMTLEFATALRRFFAPADEDLARIVASGGMVLLSPQSHLYLDRPYDPRVAPTDQRETALRLGLGSYRPRDVEHAAAWDPAAHPVPTDQVAGVEAAVWCESVNDFADLTTLLLPRLPGVAEAAWSAAPPRWEDYRLRLAGHARLWRDRGLTAFLSTEVPWR